MLPRRLRFSLEKESFFRLRGSVVVPFPQLSGVNFFPPLTL